ncbi:RNA polymerase sigma factor [Pollutibacter soli]|uniref:RNA polymerase sigma factor n=1 Tax=Pollutibacter soli TaxID=3034157 RepID=UPI0030139330
MVQNDSAINPVEFGAIAEKSFVGYYNDYREQLLFIASAILGDKNSAEDIVQELFFDLYNSDLRLDGISNVGAYLHRAVSNRSKNFIRNKQLYQSHIAKSAHLKRRIYIPEDGASELAGFVKKCLVQMPPKYSTVFILKRLYQLSLTEIAEKVKRPYDTVDKQLRKATKILKEKLESGTKAAG